jgi:hypothetical protein
MYQPPRTDNCITFSLYLCGDASSAWPVELTGLTGVSVRFWADLVHRSDRWGGPVWPIRARLVKLLCLLKWFVCIRLRGVAMVQGELACVQWELFVVFELCIGGFLLFAWACFWLSCVELLPFPKGAESFLFQVILLFAFVCLSITCLSFF